MNSQVIYRCTCTSATSAPCVSAEHYGENVYAYADPYPDEDDEDEEPEDVWSAAPEVEDGAGTANRPTREAKQGAAEDLDDYPVGFV